MDDSNDTQGLKREDPYVGPPAPVLPSPTAQAEGIGTAIHSFLGGVLRSAHAAAGRLRVRSALNPVLWACAIATPMCFIAAYFFDGNIQLYLVIVGSLPIIAVVLGFAGFAVFSPGRLQSEDYQIRQQALHLIEQRGGQLNVGTISPDAIANPRGGDYG